MYVIRHKVIQHRYCHLPTEPNTVDGNCTHGDLRIASRTDDNTDLFSEGRLEVCVNHAWGTICDTSYGTRDAHVACSQLGYDVEGKFGMSIMVTCYNALTCAILRGTVNIVNAPYMRHNI